MLALENSVRSTIAQLLGGAFLLSGLYFTWQNVLIAREGKITDRYSKAIEHLADERITVRIGGIYALERIARDSRRDHLTVMEVLTAFVRENSRFDRERDERERAAPVRFGFGESLIVREWERKPAGDIQAAVIVLGRRQWRETEAGRLDLSEVDFRGGMFGRHFEHALLIRARFDHARFVKSHLAEAVAIGAKFRDASFVGVDLRKTIFDFADLQDVKFQDCNLEGARFIGAHLERANFVGENRLVGANLEGANLNGVTGLSAAEIDGVAFDAQTIFPDGLKPSATNGDPRIPAI